MKKSYALALAIAALTGTVRAQEAADSASEPVAAESQSEQIDALKGKIDGIEESYLDTKSTVDKLAKIKVSGYIQARYEYAMDTGVMSTTSTQLQNRFKIRRGRVKVGHEGDLGDFAIQVQYAEDAIKLIDAYGSFYDPWKIAKVRVGAQDIPFGYEIGYSSSSMETMERSLFEQTVFNGEKDLGAVLFLNYDQGIFKNIDFKVGLMNGTQNVVTAPEFDDGKAVIGRVGFKLPVPDANFEIDGGVSGYYGSTLSSNDTVVDFSKQTNNVGSNNKSVGNLRDNLHKQIFGVDLQAFLNVLPLGGTVLRGEFYTGDNVSSSSNGVISAATTSPMYIKPVMGWYATLIQNVGDDFQGVFRFEQFDPNTDVSGDDIGLKSNGKVVNNTSSSDIAYTMFSVGVNYFLSGNVKLSVAYDHKMNETSASLKSTNARSDYSSDINNDLLSLQLQYKF